MRSPWYRGSVSLRTSNIWMPSMYSRTRAQITQAVRALKAGWEQFAKSITTETAAEIERASQDARHAVLSTEQDDKVMGWVRRIRRCTASTSLVGLDLEMGAAILSVRCRCSWLLRWPCCPFYDSCNTSLLWSNTNRGNFRVRIRRDVFETETPTKRNSRRTCKSRNPRKSTELNATARLCKQRIRKEIHRVRASDRGRYLDLADLSVVANAVTRHHQAVAQTRARGRPSHGQWCQRRQRGSARGERGIVTGSQDGTPGAGARSDLGSGDGQFAPTARFTNRPAQRASSSARPASRFQAGSPGTGWWSLAK